MDKIPLVGALGSSLSSEAVLPPRDPQWDSPYCAPKGRPTHFGPSHGPKVVLSSQRPGRRHTYPCPCGTPANLSPTTGREAAP